MMRYVLSILASFASGKSQCDGSWNGSFGFDFGGGR